MEYTQAEILQTVRMTEMEHLDIRTVTLGLSLLDCATDSIEKNGRARARKDRAGGGESGQHRRSNRRRDRHSHRQQTDRDHSRVAPDRRRARQSRRPRRGRLTRRQPSVGVDFIGGYSALVHKGFTRKRKRVSRFDSGSARFHRTSVLVSERRHDTRAGINMDAVARVGRLIKDAAERTRERSGLACAKFVCFANAVEDNPFMAGAFHGIGEPEAVLNVGVSGPGVVNHAVQHAPPDLPLHELAEIIKKLSFKLARAGELVGREAARRLGIPFGIIDLSLAPTPVPGDSVANIIEAMGFERAGTHGTTAALAMLTDAVKKGGAMASNSVGGMSGAFIPVSEDAGMIEAAQVGALSLEKLGSLDQRLFGRHRHGGGAGLDFRGNDRRDHRRRDGDRRDE